MSALTPEKLAELERDVALGQRDMVLDDLRKLRGAAQLVLAADTRLLLAEMETPDDKDELKAAQADYGRAMNELYAAMDEEASS